MKKWFTLVELLIVVTIIWLIAIWLWAKKNSIEQNKLKAVPNTIIWELKKLKDNAEKWVTTQYNEKFRYTAAIYDWYMSSEYESQRWDPTKSIKESKNSLIWQNSFYYWLILKPWKNYFKYFELEQEWCDSRRNNIVERLKWNVTPDNVSYINETINLWLEELFDHEPWLYLENSLKEVEARKIVRWDMITNCFVSDRNILFEESWRVFLNSIDFKDWEWNAEQISWWDSSLVFLVQAWAPNEIMMFKTIRSSWEATELNSLFMNNYSDLEWVDTATNLWSQMQEEWLNTNFWYLWKYKTDFNPLSDVDVWFSLVDRDNWTTCLDEDFVSLNSISKLKFWINRIAKKGRMCLNFKPDWLNQVVDLSQNF